MLVLVTVPYETQETRLGPARVHYSRGDIRWVSSCRNNTLLDKYPLTSECIYRIIWFCKTALVCFWHNEALGHGIGIGSSSHELFAWKCTGGAIRQPMPYPVLAT